MIVRFYFVLQLSYILPDYFIQLQTLIFIGFVSHSEILSVYKRLTSEIFHFFACGNK